MDNAKIYRECANKMFPPNTGYLPDKSGISQYLAETFTVLESDKLYKKWKKFRKKLQWLGWNICEVDGHLLTNSYSKKAGYYLEASTNKIDTVFLSSIIGDLGHEIEYPGTLSYMVKSEPFREINSNQVLVKNTIKLENAFTGDWISFTYIGEPNEFV